MQLLKKYWFKFEIPTNSDYPLGLLAGCGVTAYSYDDALKLIETHIFKDRPTPPIQDFVENVDVSTLDKNHIIPNMEPPLSRGIWFPRGYK